MPWCFIHLWIEMFRCMHFQYCKHNSKTKYRKLRRSTPSCFKGSVREKWNPLKTFLFFGNTPFKVFFNERDCSPYCKFKWCPNKLNTSNSKSKPPVYWLKNVWCSGGKNKNKTFKSKFFLIYFTKTFIWLSQIQRIRQKNASLWIRHPLYNEVTWNCIYHAKTQYGKIK